MSYTILTINLVGQIFGRLLVLSEGARPKQGRMWLCKCSCGIEKLVLQGNLRFGRVLSCGCLNQELKQTRFSHHMVKTKEYRAWANMWARCTNPKSIGYLHYQHRTPPDEWRNFEVFFKEVGLCPSPDHSLDRIKNHLPYGPGNVRWATRTTQARNRVSNKLVRYDGTIMSLAEACEHSKLNPRTVGQRLRKGQSYLKASEGHFEEASMG